MGDTPQPELEPEPSSAAAAAADSDSSSDGGIGALFAASDDESEDEAPAAVELEHAASGLSLRAFGVQFGRTTGLALWSAAPVQQPRLSLP